MFLFRCAFSTETEIALSVWGGLEKSPRLFNEYANDSRRSPSSLETNVLMTHDPLDSTRSVCSIPWPLFTPREANMGLRHVNWCNRPLRSTRLVRRCLGARYHATGRFKSPNHCDFNIQGKKQLQLKTFLFNIWINRLCEIIGGTNCLREKWKR